MKSLASVECGNNKNFLTKLGRRILRRMMRGGGEEGA